MSNCSIITGKKVHAVSRSSNAEETNRAVLFDSLSTNTVTHVVTVGECKALKISTFALPAGKKILVHRVYLGGGVMPFGSGCACGADEGKSAIVQLSEPLRIRCCDVAIDGCAGMLFLTIPGDYVFELEDKTLLGQFVALAEEVECCCLPESTVIGSEIPTGGIVGVECPKGGNGNVPKDHTPPSPPPPEKPKEPETPRPQPQPQPETPKPQPKRSKVEIEFFVDDAAVDKLSFDGEVGTKIPRDAFNAKLNEYLGQGKELVTTTFAEGETFLDIDYTKYYLVKLRTVKLSKVIFKRVILPKEGSIADPVTTTLGEVTGKVGDEIPRTIYDNQLKIGGYKFVSSDFIPPMYFADTETPKVYTITLQEYDFNPVWEDGSATANFKFIKQDTRQILKEFSVMGIIGKPVPRTRYDEVLLELQNQGYTLVSTTFNSSNASNPSNIFTGDSRDDFEIIMKEEVVPFDPNTPPRKPNPIAPDGPNDPMVPR